LGFHVVQKFIREREEVVKPPGDFFGTSERAALYSKGRDLISRPKLQAPRSAPSKKRGQAAPTGATGFDSLRAAENSRFCSLAQKPFVVAKGDVK
jgi:hypothetical protein